MTHAPYLTRRSLLASSVFALGGAVFSGWGLPAHAATAAGPRVAPAGFLGERTLLLMVHDGRIARFGPVPAPEGAGPRIDPTSRYGGLGRLGDRQAHFSGGRNTALPRLVTFWPERRGAAFNPAFAPKGAQAVVAADRPGAWAVSIDGRPVAVAAVARKTVPVRSAEIARGDVAHETRHLVTLTLDAAIPPGARIELRAPFARPVRLTRQDDAPSEIVHVCQAGYPLAGPKRGYVGQWLGQDAEGRPRNTDAALSEAVGWRLVAARGGDVVASGRLTALPAREFEGHALTGCRLYEADFSTLETAGRYRLEVEGIGSSMPFELTERPYDEALRLAARWYYHQRSGIAIAAPYGEGRSRPRNGHPADGLTVWQSDVMLAETSEGLGGPYAPRLIRNSPHGGAAPAPGAALQAGQPNPEAWGGWHDAADWDRRAQHLEVVYSLAWLIETLPRTAALGLNLPESGRSFADPAIRARVDETDRGDGETVLPDLLHEALWGISFWRRTQRPDGGILGGLEYSQVGIKGSYSWDPVERSHAYAPDPWAAWLFAGAAAKLGHVIATRVGDAVLGARLIAEARRAWDWAEAQDVATGLRGEDGVSGEHRRLWQPRVAAAATLYRATGAQEAAALFESVNPFLSEAGHKIGLRRSVYTAQSLDYHFAGIEGRPVKADLRAAIATWVRGYPGRDRRNRISRDFGLHSTTAYPWGRGWLRFGPGANWPAQHIALAFSVAGDLTSEVKNRAIQGMWFALGCNPSNVSFIQGLGRRDFADPLLLDDTGGAKIPGQPSFGVAGGALHDWEKSRIAGALYPAAQEDWPLYAQIYESRHVAICAEHGIKSNALEWLIACALVHEIHDN